MIETTASAIQAPLSPPEARGFRMLIERQTPGINGKVFLILQRTEEGSPALFGQIAGDVLKVIERCGSAAAATEAFIARMVAWKKFMHDQRDAGMSDIEEVGLVGELLVMDACIAVFGPDVAVHAWVGNERGLHDFTFGVSGIEVKTTLGGHNLAHIFSIDQLDPSGLQDLFLFRVQARLDANGKTLPELVDELLLRCGGQEDNLRGKLLRAGYADASRERFTRRYSLVGVEAFDVRDGFPCLRRAELAPAITDASYWLDLRQAGAFSLSLEAAFARIGATSHGP